MSYQRDVDQRATPGNNPKFPKNLYLISLLSTTGKLFEKVILKTVQRHIEERGLLNVSQYISYSHNSRKPMIQLGGKYRSILIKSGVPMKQVRLIKMFLN
jgi:hypothetical protein